MESSPVTSATCTSEHSADTMKLQAKQIKSIDFKVPAPDSEPTRFVRRGILGCYESTGCSFVVLHPASVHSLN
jgi:hypothetical protein